MKHISGSTHAQEFYGSSSPFIRAGRLWSTHACFTILALHSLGWACFQDYNQASSVPDKFPNQSLNYIHYLMFSGPSNHLMVEVAVTRARSPDSCSVCALPHWPSDYMDVLWRFRILILYVVWQASSHRALSWTAVLGAESCLPIWKSAAGSMGLDRKPGWLNTQVQDQRRL